VEEWARRRGLRGDLQAQTRHGSGEPNAPPIGAGYRETADDLGGSSETISETHQALSDGPAWAKARLFSSPSSTALGSCLPPARDCEHVL
jgi:hypothetical protein